MNVHYSDKIKQPGEWNSLLEQATSLLEEILGSSADRVRASWEQTENAGGRPVFTLTLRDWTGEASVTFTLSELQSPSQAHYRLNRLWGDLLQVRSHKLLDTLLEATGPSGG